MLVVAWVYLPLLILEQLPVWGLSEQFAGFHSCITQWQRTREALDLGIGSGIKEVQEVSALCLRERMGFMALSVRAPRP
jgi:hypothetical protein